MSTSFKESKDKIAKICQYFANNHQEFLAPGTKEDHVRRLLIDPFFEALGWDVRNTAVLSEISEQWRKLPPNSDN